MPNSQRTLAAPTYLVAVGLACIPMFDAAMQTMPLRFGQARWRFGAFGLMSNAFVLMLAGFLIAFVGSSVFEHRRTHRVLGYAALLGGIVTIAGLLLFGLDALEVRRGVAITARLAFHVATITAAAKAIFVVVTLFVAARASRGAPTITRARTESNGILVPPSSRAQRAV